LATVTVLNKLQTDNGAGSNTLSPMSPILPWSTVLDKRTVPQLVKQLNLMELGRFITVFTTALHLFLS